MAFLQWRKFAFFESETVKDPETNKPLELLKNVSVSCSTYGWGHLVIGDTDGMIHIVNRQMIVSSFKAYDLRVSHMKLPKDTQYLVTIGEDEPGINPLIKVWNLERMDKKSTPLCVRILRTMPGNKPTEVSYLEITDNLSHTAVGFVDGSVLLYKRDIVKNKQVKPNAIVEGSANKKSVSGLVFRVGQKTAHLFIVTANSVVSYNINARDREQAICYLEDSGCPVNCLALTDEKLDQQLIVGCKNALYFYQPDNRGQCLAFEGEKIILRWFRNYLVVISQESAAAKNPSLSTGIPPLASTSMSIMTVYDIANKYVAYAAPIGPVFDVAFEWGSLYIMLANKQLMFLREKDLQSKLNILFKKNMYVMAIQLAKSQQYDSDGLCEIFRQYADHLYAKGDLDSAITQYIKTIGKLEASYVIRKFLDAQRIHNLTAYLQELHVQGLANEDHTTLLLNCYTKLKDIERLDQFIMTENREVNFDVETAIKVLRRAGYHKHALYLAEKHGQHEWFLKIQIEDLDDFETTLRYISALSSAEAEMYVKKYGRFLLKKNAEKTTEFLVGLCTSYIGRNDIEASAGAARSEEFIHLFVDNRDMLITYLEQIIKGVPLCHPSVYNTLLDLYLSNYSKTDDSEARAEVETKIMGLLHSPESTYDVNHALILCRMNNFQMGILLLYERAKLYQQILKYHIENSNNALVLETCKKFGNHDTSLWVQALLHFSSSDQSQKGYLSEVLSNIEKKKLLSPLMVIEIISNSSTATIAVIKDYVLKQLQAENEQLNEDKRLIDQYKAETDKMINHIEFLKSSPQIFQASKCNACCHAMDLPSVHFLCQHSFHQHCFESYSENDSECPVCHAENEKLQEVAMHAQNKTAEMQEQFNKELLKAEDKFSVVAEYFGRNLFNKVTVVTDANSQLMARNKQVAMAKLANQGRSDNQGSSRRGAGDDSKNPFHSDRSEYDVSLNPFEN